MKITKEGITKRLRKLASHVAAAADMISVSVSHPGSLSRSAGVMGDISDHAISIGIDIVNLDLDLEDHPADGFGPFGLATETDESKQ